MVTSNRINCIEYFRLFGCTPTITTVLQPFKTDLDYPSMWYITILILKVCGNSESELFHYQTMVILVVIIIIYTT